MRIRLHNTTPGHNKFWEISQDGPTVTARWGKIGSSGQTANWNKGDDATAFVEKRVREQMSEGYTFHSGDDEARWLAARFSVGPLVPYPYSRNSPPPGHAPTAPPRPRRHGLTAHTVRRSPSCSGSGRFRWTTGPTSKC